MTRMLDQLEADWNSKLRELHSAQEEYERQKQNQQRAFSAEHLKASPRELRRDPLR